MHFTGCKILPLSALKIVFAAAEAENKMTREQPTRLFICQCTPCRKQPRQATAELHANIIEMVALRNEKHRRQFAALMALQFGQAGSKQIAEITGISRNTITRGKRELSEADFNERVRAPGAGRRLTEKKSRSC